MTRMKAMHERELHVVQGIHDGLRAIEGWEKADGAGKLALQLRQ